MARETHGMRVGIEVACRRAIFAFTWRGWGISARAVMHGVAQGESSRIGKTRETNQPAGLLLQTHLEDSDSQQRKGREGGLLGWQRASHLIDGSAGEIQLGFAVGDGSGNDSSALSRPRYAAILVGFARTMLEGRDKRGRHGPGGPRV